MQLPKNLNPVSRWLINVGFNVTGVGGVFALMDHVLVPNRDFVAGFGDTLHFGIYGGLRHKLAGWNADNEYGSLFNVNECSQEYKYGHEFGSILNKSMAVRSGYKFMKNAGAPAGYIEYKLRKTELPNSYIKIGQ